MRPLALNRSLRWGAAVLVLGTAWSLAQNSGDSTSAPQLPVGQTFKQFEYPIYQQGVLKATLSAVSATGITLNRAETSDLVINIYDTTNAPSFTTSQTPTTVVTSPKADLYVSEQKMRTKDTVDIERADMTATAQTCDFDLKNKKYLLRTNVKVTLKHFDLSSNPSGKPAATPTKSAKAPAPATPQPARDNSSLLDSPGSYAAPTAPSNNAK